MIISFDYSEIQQTICIAHKQIIFSYRSGILMTSKVALIYMMSDNYLKFILKKFYIVFDMVYRLIMIPNCNLESLRTRAFILNWK